ncbi:hypothetical protein D1831_13845 [Lactiplantibacillus garii]|uniref:ABC transporter permease n=1 Tax=Lactiplantibacillus garii TaxID=2306423 RepID=A0A426D3U0_9LACO|nr:ABC transporter permease [Lactiplantibacillus garii]RRK09240.1 hypothetical protein D1831_13845 [Lactiplantibacillus garii]
MITLVRQELYKLSKQRPVRLFFGFLLLFQVILAVYTARYPQFLTSHDSFINGFYAYIPTTFFLIAIGSTHLTIERQAGTLRLLLYRQYSRTTVLLSKWLSILILSISVYLDFNVVGLIIKLLFFRNLPLKSAL